jgi:hypothetical protein
LIDAQIHAGGIGGQVVLPARIEVPSTVRIAGVRGLRISGAAPVASELLWAGPSETPMFDVDCCQDVLFEHFSISVDKGKTLAAAAWIQNGPGGIGPKSDPGLESSRVSWNNVVIRGRGQLVRGLYVKLFDVDKDVKNDHYTFDRVVVTGYTEAAFTFEGRNAKNLGLERCQCTGYAGKVRVGKYAIDTATHPGHGGAFYWSNGMAGGNAEADFRIGDRNDTIKIDGVYSEKSARMLVMPHFTPGGGAACPVLLENYRFAAASPDLLAEDAEIVQCETAGPLTMIACKMGSSSKGQQLRIRYEPPTPPGAFVFLGNAIGSDGENDHKVFVALPPTMAYENANLGYRQKAWRPLGPSQATSDD